MAVLALDELLPLRYELPLAGQGEMVYLAGSAIAARAEGALMAGGRGDCALHTLRERPNATC